MIRRYLAVLAAAGLPLLALLGGCSDGLCVPALSPSGDYTVHLIDSYDTNSRFKLDASNGGHTPGVGQLCGLRRHSTRNGARAEGHGSSGGNHTCDEVKSQLVAPPSGLTVVGPTSNLRALDTTYAFEGRFVVADVTTPTCGECGRSTAPDHRRRRHGEDADARSSSRGAHRPRLGFAPDLLRTFSRRASQEMTRGTTFDCFDDRAHLDADVPPEARSNRQLLRDAMEKAGFVVYDDKEWWHFSLANEPFPDTSFDFRFEIAPRAGM